MVNEVMKNVLLVKKTRCLKLGQFILRNFFVWFKHLCSLNTGPRNIETFWLCKVTNTRPFEVVDLTLF